MVTPSKANASSGSRVLSRSRTYVASQQLHLACPGIPPARNVATTQIERRKHTDIHREEGRCESAQLVQGRREAFIKSAEWLEIKLAAVSIWLVWPGSDELLECLAGFRVIRQPVVGFRLRYRLKILSGLKRPAKLVGKSAG